MSRVGKRPIPIPKDVKVSISVGAVDVQGPKGRLTQYIPPGIGFELADSVLEARIVGEQSDLGKFHGLARTLVANAVKGVVEGFSRELDIVGIGYRADVKGKQVIFMLGYSNTMAVPKLEKIVVNMGLGEATGNIKILDVGSEEIGRITCQKAVSRKAKKSVAVFKVREGMPIGSMVTLRSEQMYQFLDRLISIALPRVRDFRGISPKGFDGRGNYTLGLRDQLIFPEIDYMRVDKNRGMNISMVTTAQTDEEARQLLKLLGMPFRQN